MRTTHLPFSDMRPLVRSATLNGYGALARSLDLDAARLMRKVGLDPADLVVPDKWISAAAVARLLDASATKSGHPDFAVRLAEARRLSTLGPLSVVLREEPDLRSVLNLLLRYEHSYNEAIRMRLDESEEIATLRLWFEFGEPAPSQQALALGVAALHGIMRECVGRDWRPLATCFSQRAPADLETIHRNLGPGVQFEHDFTGIVFYASDLDAANSLSDPLMRPYAQRLLDSMVSPRAAMASARVRELVELFLPLGKCSMSQVARALDMDKRTLHRHLAIEGETFSSILSSTRSNLAERYLANDRYSMSEITYLLGFAASSAFSRWFHQHFGVSPSVWREHSAAGSEADH
jgi:AraC-like DNA-binding protein